MNFHLSNRILTAGLMALTLAACKDKLPEPTASAQPKPTATPSATTPPARPPARPPAHSTPDTEAPVAALNTMDPRTPVPLQPMMAWHQKQNMQQHLVAIQRITDALSREDWKAIADASAMIETSPQMQQMCEHMGAGAEGFTERALKFHATADTIAVAAKAKDTRGVLQATSKTLQACTGCHATYRQDVVDAATWQARTGSKHDPAAMHDMP